MLPPALPARLISILDGDHESSPFRNKLSGPIHWPRSKPCPLDSTRTSFSMTRDDPRQEIATEYPYGSSLGDISNATQHPGTSGTMLAA